jgi:aminopeptidase N
MNAAPATTRLVDYAPPPYLVDHVELDFQLDTDRTVVTSTLHLRRNPQAKSVLDLTLHGCPDAEESGQLLSLAINGEQAPVTSYRLTDKSLVLLDVPEKFTLTTTKQLQPKGNKSLEGLYASGSGLFTQCEAEGFRKITWCLDRPDVLSTYRVTLRANAKRFPVLLSNGNLVSQHDDGDQQVATWDDPWPKPSYLFAIVAADLSARTDTFTTMEGREVTLNVWVKPSDLDQTEHCMKSLIKSMKWDETRFGRAYDLNVFNLVAVSDFNMGAMENKGLNIFNTKYVLAKPDTATDADYDAIEAVVGHEYFHNWSGNRVTCRDWFQLSLKEGFTVFRDQEFSSDVGSRAVKRIEEVRKLRAMQFPEDNGPTAHPVRPDAYQEISNFYTLTIYEKGAEVVRMLHTLLGEAAFRRGTDLYFSRHDGQAATCDDFVACMAEVSGRDLTQFKLWYSQAGTPKLTVTIEDDRARQSCTVHFQQEVPDTPGQTHKQPMVIPVRAAFLANGVRVEAIDERNQVQCEPLLVVNQSQQSFRFSVPGKAAPVLSLLRGFSAPVRLDMAEPEADLLVRLAHDDDAFNRSEAGQQLLMANLVRGVEQIQSGQIPSPPSAALVAACTQALHDALENKADPALVALTLSVPGIDVIGQRLPWADYTAAHQAREALITSLSQSMSAGWQSVEQQLTSLLSGQAYVFAPQPVAQRSLRNVAMAYLSRTDVTAAHRHLQRATCLTDVQAALALLAHSDDAQRQPELDAFYARWSSEALMVDKWFAMQSQSTRSAAFDDVKRLLAHPAFTLENPNRARSVVSAFAMGNPLHFHHASGRGYQLLADQIVALDAFNPQIAARLLLPLTQWRRQDPSRQAMMKVQLERVLSRPASTDVAEIATKALNG